MVERDGKGEEWKSIGEGKTRKTIDVPDLVVLPSPVHLVLIDRLPIRWLASDLDYSCGSAILLIKRPLISPVCAYQSVRSYPRE